MSDRDRMLAKDMIMTAAFTGGQGRLEDGDKDICLQQFCAERRKAGAHQPWEEGQEALFGRSPWLHLPKKDVYADGQIIQANPVTPEGRRRRLRRGSGTGPGLPPGLSRGADSECMFPGWG